MRFRTAVLTALTGVFACGLATDLMAKPAQCFTTDDGHFDCDFRALDRSGSFRITAPGYPTITLQVDTPDQAWGFANFGSRNVSLPGPYIRAEDDRACWDNPDTSNRICAW